MGLIKSNLGRKVLHVCRNADPRGQFDGLHASCCFGLIKKKKKSTIAQMKRRV